MLRIVNKLKWNYLMHFTINGILLRFTCNSEGNFIDVFIGV